MINGDIVYMFMQELGRMGERVHARCVLECPPCMCVSRDQLSLLDACIHLIPRTNGKKKNKKIPLKLLFDGENGISVS